MKKIFIIAEFLKTLQMAASAMCDGCFERLCTAMLEAGNKEVAKIRQEHESGELPEKECSEGEALKNEINNLFSHN